MDSRERYFNCINRTTPDRLPIRHLALPVINERLREYFGIGGTEGDDEALLGRLGVDFRDIRPTINGDDFGLKKPDERISACVWNGSLSKGTGKDMPLVGVEDISEIPTDAFPSADKFDYNVLPGECEKHSQYVRIFGYNEFDFINGISSQRGNEQVLEDIALREKVYLDLLRIRFEFVMEHIERALKACDGLIDIVFFGDDFGSQKGLLISPDSFRDIFAPYYREGFALAHKYGAKTMLHSCGSCRSLIGDFIDTGLDILDVVQTDAAYMVLEELKEEFGRDIVFCGSMSVQELIPYGTREQVTAEANRRAELFREGGLIYGPSHVMQLDSILENILQMYGSILKKDL